MDNLSTTDPEKGTTYNQGHTPVGTALKARREELQVKLSDVAFKTRINLSILKALEENKLDELPNKTYVKGFARTYAKELRLNGDEVLEQLENTYKHFYSSEEEETPVKEDSSTKKEKSYVNKIPKEASSSENKVQYTLSYLVIIGGLCSLLVYRYQNLFPSKKAAASGQTKGRVDNTPRKINRDRFVDKPLLAKKMETTKIETSKTSSPIASKEITPPVSPKNVTGRKVEGEGEEILALEGPKTKVEALTPDPAKKEVAAEVPRAKESAEPPKVAKVSAATVKKIQLRPFVTNNITLNGPQNASEAYPAAIRSKVNLEMQNVYLNASEGDTWLTYKVDGQGTRTFTLKQGKRIFLQGKLIRIFLGNIHSAKVYYNHSEVESSSKTGVKSLVFPPSKVKDFHLPLFIYQDNGTTITSDEYLSKQENREVENEDA